MNTIGHYLTRRLEQAGVRHLFGVAGDYVLNFFDCLLKSRVELVTNCNELNAGYAADAYARLNGVGAVGVTYGVGGFSLYNAVVGAFAERVPVIVISGAPKADERHHHHLLHHTIGEMDLQFKKYEKITIASAALISIQQAPQQIDETVAACLKYRRPVYIEIPMDMVAMPCPEPGEFNIDTDIKSEREALDEAVEEAVSLLSASRAPVILVGVEAHRLGIRKELANLVDHTGFPFATTLLGKAVLPEKHPLFIGVYTGAVGPECVRKAIEESDLVLSLGALMTDINLGVYTARLDPSRMIVANSDNVRIKHHDYQNVSLKDFINGLRKKLPVRKIDLSGYVHPCRWQPGGFTPQKNRRVTVKRFYEALAGFIRKGHIIVADTGDALLGSADLYLPENVEYIGQAFYMSIGYALPGALGAALAAPKRRIITLIGDGAFQMTAQELSTIIRHRLDPIIILLNNDGYAVERLIHDGPYNDIHMWKYHKLPEVFNGGRGFLVKTEEELEGALTAASGYRGGPSLIEVVLDRFDSSDSLRRLGERLGRSQAT